MVVQPAGVEIVEALELGRDVERGRRRPRAAAVRGPLSEAGIGARQLEPARIAGDAHEPFAVEPHDPDAPRAVGMDRSRERDALPIGRGRRVGAVPQHAVAEHGARGAVRVAQHQPAARYCGPVVRPDPGDRAALRERRA